jgi:hemerythrin
VNQPALPAAYKIGINDLDEQHSVLFEHLRDLDASIAAGDRWVVVHNTLTELVHWTQLHFAVEESVMRICRYPDLERHIEQHHGFVAKVQQMKQKSLTDDIAAEASTMLHDWLVHHIQIEDRKYADHFLTVSERFALALDESKTPD